MIPCSNSKGDSSVKIKQTIVNCHTRAYHEKGGCGKHEMWSSQILNVSKDLKHGLQGVVKVDVQMRSNEDKPRLTKEGRLKCVNHGNGRNEGSTCMMHEGYSWGRKKRTQKPTVVVQNLDEGFCGLDVLHGYGGKNGHGSIGRREIRSQRVGSRSISIIDNYLMKEGKY